MEQSAKEQLYARLSDLSAQAENGKLAVSKFLTPGERKQAEQYLSRLGIDEYCRFWGGYAGAERTCLLVFPDYYSAIPGGIPEVGNDPSPMLSEEENIVAIEIRGSGFRTLSHRDYLGSLLGLGVERDSIGDIAVQDEHTAVVFCTAALSKYLLAQLEYVASDKVKCKKYEMREDFTDGRHYRPISDTVASPRLDCVVAALTNLSREAAQTHIRSKNVDVDFELEERCDRMLTPPATLSIRGYGRYELRAFDGETKKGRLRLRADQLI